MTDLETILERVNLNRAFKEVVANKGSAGVDGMGSRIFVHIFGPTAPN